MDLLLHIPGLSCLWWLLLAMLLPLLLGLLLGYWLWYHYRGQAQAMRAERDDYHARFTEMETEYASLKYKYEELQKEHHTTRNALHASEADIAVLQGKLQRALASIPPPAEGAEALGIASVAPPPHNYTLIFSPDNLQVIEGIGPKVEEILRRNGISDWKALAAQSAVGLRILLEDAGSDFGLVNPESWPKQAALARDTKWDELVTLQKSLNAGSEGDDSPAKVERLAARVMGFSNSNPDDLKIIEGIGPKIEQLLKDAGINNWSELAAASPERIREILAAAGERYRLADPATWPQQAALAATGQWQELRDYQDDLKGGRS